MTQLTCSFKKPIDTEVTFMRSGIEVIALKDVLGMLATIRPSVHGSKPSQGQTWNVRLDGNFVFDTGKKHASVTCVLLEQVVWVQSSDPKASATTSGDESEYVFSDIDLEFVRGTNTTTGDEQWEHRSYDKDTCKTTLYVADRYSDVIPAMNGERFACSLGRVLFESETFEIRLVTLHEKVDPNIPAPARRRIRRHARTRSQIRATSVDRRRQVEQKSKNKGQKKARA